MALEKIDTDENFSGVTGVFAGQKDTPVFLGEKKYSVSLNNHAGNDIIVVGFDTRISPAQFSVFYQRIQGDMTTAEIHYGLVMTKEICFDGLPIQPSVFSNAIAYQDSYSSFVKDDNIFNNNPISPAFAVEMLSPKQLKAEGINDPFFAYNALAHMPDFTKEDAFKFNTINGFLASSENVSEKGAPLCASLMAPLGIDIEGPFHDDILDFIDYQTEQGIKPVAKFKISDKEINEGLLLDKVLSIDKNNPIPLEQVIDMKMVADYLLVILDNPENYYTVLIADPFKGNVYLYDIDLLEDIQTRNTRDFFDRFTDFTIDNHRFNSAFPNKFYFGNYTAKDQVKKMRSGGEHHLQFNYRIYAVEGWTFPETGLKEHHCRGGVQFSVRRTFDKDQLQFNHLEFSTPEALSLEHVVNFNKEMYLIGQGEKAGDMPELTNYFEALKKDINAYQVNALQWFRTNPPLSTDIVIEKN